MKKLDQLKKIAEKYGIALIYLFGSQAKNGVAYLYDRSYKIKKESDLDIGVVFKNFPINVKEKVKVFGDLYTNLALLFDPFEIDLIFLQEVNSLLQLEAIKGVAIYIEDETFQEEYEELVMKKAEDLRFKKREFDKEVLEARKNGYFEVKL
jgi:predicted nucleotidyltransferase